MGRQAQALRGRAERDESCLLSTDRFKGADRSRIFSCASNSPGGQAGTWSASLSRSHLGAMRVDDGFAHFTTSFDATVESALSV
jgi:hypothetical protein